MMIKVGDNVPKVTLRQMSSDGPEVVDLIELCAGKKAVIFGVPGAFTPTCNAKHLPEFVASAGAFSEKGVDFIACISVNDVFVMEAWKNHAGVGKKVMMLSDGNGDFARATGLEMDVAAFGMGSRLKRFAMIVDDGVVTVLNVEEGGAYEVSKAETVLALL